MAAYGGLSKSFRIQSGVRQGCPLSPFLFNSVIDETMRRTLKGLQNPDVQIAYNECFVNLDIIHMFEEEEKTQVVLYELTKVIPSFGMHSAPTNHAPGHTDTEHSTYNPGEALEVVEHFTYLRSCISSNCSVTVEVSTLICKARAAITNLRHLWRQNGPSLKLKGSVYQATVRAVLLYGCETWPVRAAEVRRLQVFDNRYFKAIARVGWCRRIRNEAVRNRIYGYATDTSIEECVQHQKLRWLGHAGVKEITKRLDTVDATRLPGWGLRGPHCAWLETPQNMLSTNVSDVLVQQVNAQNPPRLSAPLDVDQTDKTPSTCSASQPCIKPRQRDSALIKKLLTKLLKNSPQPVSPYSGLIRVFMKETTHKVAKKQPTTGFALLGAHQTVFYKYTHLQINLVSSRDSTESIVCDILQLNVLHIGRLSDEPQEGQSRLWVVEEFSATFQVKGYTLVCKLIWFSEKPTWNPVESFGFAVSKLGLDDYQLWLRRMLHEVASSEQAQSVAEANAQLREHGELKAELEDRREEFAKLIQYGRCITSGETDKHYVELDQRLDRLESTWMEVVQMWLHRQKMLEDDVLIQIVQSWKTSSTINYGDSVMCYACQNTVNRGKSCSPCLLQNGARFTIYDLKGVKDITKGLDLAGASCFPACGPQWLFMLGCGHCKKRRHIYVINTNLVSFLPDRLIKRLEKLFSEMRQLETIFGTQSNRMVDRELLQHSQKEELRRILTEQINIVEKLKACEDKVEDVYRSGTKLVFKRVGPMEKIQNRIINLKSRPLYVSVGTIFEISQYIFIKETTHKVAENSSTAHDQVALLEAHQGPPNCALMMSPLMAAKRLQVSFQARQTKQQPSDH
ncbi:LOW QUALITY PROTEIN: hypothetical protein T265_12961 [Opisthorchis viverrini]|uniref:Reverse transcriptase domain-containing protein n=1 Tax=Opisthorchis viverrini TaxID=6198 RepID=A0A074ZWF7_OPIVI|nr:LOW QUALITY PROTEIN: hypothetical protein T265_12961 [Opisthorchis viverrini]KER31471.1 LOW QUALITY PROTEIN: hypothetical protein T265_12961 [Opisthorchis viverrini]